MRRFPPSGYFVGSAVFHYLGPAFAVLLFTRAFAAPTLRGHPARGGYQTW